MKLKIMTYNVGHGVYSKDYKKGNRITRKDVMNNISGCIEIIKSNNPDIVLLQETGLNNIYCHYINHNKKLYIEEYNNKYLSNRKIPLIIDIGNTILSKKKFNSKYNKITTSYRLPGFTHNFFCQNKNSIKIIIDDLIVYNIHLSPYNKNKQQRDKQLLKILEDAKKQFNNGYKVIIGGDFNMDLKNGIAYLADPFKLFISSQDTCRELNDYFSKNKTHLIDGYIVSKNIKVKSITSLYNFDYSDHSPILLEVDV